MPDENRSTAFRAQADEGEPSCSDPLLGSLHSHPDPDPTRATHTSSARGFDPPDPPSDPYVSTPQRLALRLQALDHPIAPTLLRCAQRSPPEEHGAFGYRCNQTLICARCAPRASVKQRRAIEQDLQELPPGTKVALVTLTANAPTIELGRAAFRSSFAALRRHRAWASAIEGGRGAIEVKPSPGGTWHVHAHVVAYRRRHRRINEGKLTAEWHRLVSPLGVAGGVNVRPIPRRFDTQARNFSPVAFYSVKREREPWLDYSDADLLTLIDALRGRRWTIHFGGTRETAK